MSQQNNHSDPYKYDQAYSSHPPLPHHQSDGSTSYNDDPIPYGQDSAYPSYPSHPLPGDYQAYSSSEKMVEEGAYNTEGTERAQPGRSGLRQPTRSFAELGPPPRSTGILRMWRKDERGKQWFRVSSSKGVLAYGKGWRLSVMSKDMLLLYDNISHHGSQHHLSHPAGE